MAKRLNRAPPEIEPEIEPEIPDPWPTQQSRPSWPGILIFAVATAAVVDGVLLYRKYKGKRRR